MLAEFVKVLYSGTQISGSEVLLLYLMTLFSNSVFIHSFPQQVFIKHLLGARHLLTLPLSSLFQ